MGKEKISSSRSKLFSPWQLTDNDSKGHYQFELFGKNNEFESMDKNMTQTILAIERNQLQKIEQDREEDIVEDHSLLSQAQNLGIHASSENTPFQLSKADQDMVDLFTISNQAIVTLEQAVTEKGSPPSGDQLCLSDPQVRQVYTRIGEYLSRYQLGKMPKAFKIIPSLNNWEHILLLTKPQSWTAAATFEATKVFLTSIKPTQTKQFFQWVLLPNVRDNLKDKQSLDLPMYLALQKSLQKSPCFFIKGFLLPLCESNCTILEASVLANVILQCKVPVFQSATALLKLSELKFTLPTGILVSVFLEKRQALPFRVVDALVARYFMTMKPVGRQLLLPHIWFQTLYSFVQSYGMDLIATQKQKLLHLVQSIQQHELSKLIESLLILKESELAYSDDSDMMSE